MTQLFRDLAFEPFVKDKRERIRLEKRLQQGRKFCVLADVFGTSILHAVPEVSVTRLDVVSLKALMRLQTGSMEQIKVKAILSRMGSWVASLSCALAGLLTVNRLQPVRSTTIGAYNATNGTHYDSNTEAIMFQSGLIHWSSKFKCKEGMPKKAH